MRVKMMPVPSRPSTHCPASNPRTTEIASVMPKEDATTTDWRTVIVVFGPSNGDLAMPCRVVAGTLSLAEPCHAACASSHAAEVAEVLESCVVSL